MKSILSFAIGLCFCQGVNTTVRSAEAKEYPTVSTTAKPSTSNSTGLLNDWLREQSTTASAWDVGGQVRLRYEVKDNAGSFPNRDFIADGQDSSNDFLMLRTKLHLGDRKSVV